MNKIYFLIGSSGAGKTTAAEAIEAMNIANLIVCFPDREKIPSFEEMTKKHGHTDEWQKMHTFAWIEKARNEFLGDNNVLIDTQSRPCFIKEGCEKYEIGSYEIILFDCSDAIRKERLTQRGHPELANDKMMDWARYLREACKGYRCHIVDNTKLTKEESKQALLDILNETEK